MSTITLQCANDAKIVVKTAILLTVPFFKVVLTHNMEEKLTQIIKMPEDTVETVSLYLAYVKSSLPAALTTDKPASEKAPIKQPPSDESTTPATLPLPLDDVPSTAAPLDDTPSVDIPSSEVAPTVSSQITESKPTRKWPESTFDQLARAIVFANKLQDMEAVTEGVKVLSYEVNKYTINSAISWLRAVGDTFDTTIVRQTCAHMLKKFDIVREMFFAQADTTDLIYALSLLPTTLGLWGLCWWLSSGNEWDPRLLLALPAIPMEDSPLVPKIVEMVMKFNQTELTQLVLTRMAARLTCIPQTFGIGRLVTLEEFDIKKVTFLSPESRMSPPMGKYGESANYTSSSIWYDGEPNWALELPSGTVNGFTKREKKRPAKPPSLAAMMAPIMPPFPGMIPTTPTFPGTLPTPSLSAQLPLPSIAPEAPAPSKELEEPKKERVASFSLELKSKDDQKRVTTVFDSLRCAVIDFVTANYEAFRAYGRDFSVEKRHNIVESMTNNFATRWPSDTNVKKIFIPNIHVHYEEDKRRIPSQIVNHRTGQPATVTHGAKIHRCAISMYLWAGHSKPALAKSLRYVEVE